MEQIIYETVYDHNTYTKILLILFLIMLLFYFLTVSIKIN